MSGSNVGIGLTTTTKTTTDLVNGVGAQSLHPLDPLRLHHVSRLALSPQLPAQHQNTHVRRSIDPDVISKLTDAGHVHRFSCRRTIFQKVRPSPRARALCFKKQGRSTAKA